VSRGADAAGRSGEKFLAAGGVCRYAGHLGDAARARS